MWKYPLLFGWLIGLLIELMEKASNATQHPVNYHPRTKYDERLCFHTCLSVHIEVALVSGP